MVSPASSSVPQPFAPSPTGIERRAVRKLTLPTTLIRRPNLGPHMSPFESGTPVEFIVSSLTQPSIEIEVEAQNNNMKLRQFDLSIRDEHIELPGLLCMDKMNRV